MAKRLEGVVLRWSKAAQLFDRLFCSIGNGIACQREFDVDSFAAEAKTPLPSPLELRGVFAAVIGALSAFGYQCRRVKLSSDTNCETALRSRLLSFISRLYHPPIASQPASPSSADILASLVVKPLYVRVLSLREAVGT